MKRIIIISVLISSSCFSQTSYKEKYAHSLFEKLEFTESAVVYEEIAEKQSKKDDEYSVSALYSAESYYHARNYIKSVAMFKMAKESFFSDENYKQYLDAIIRTKNWDLLNGKDALVLKYYGLRIAELREQIEQLLKIENHSIKEVSFNSGMGDYSPSWINGRLFFSSNRSDFGYTHEEYLWDGLNYSNVYMDSLGSAVLVKEMVTKYHDGPVVCDNNGNYYVSQTSTLKNGDKHVKVVVYKSGKAEEFFLNSDQYNIGHIAFNSDYSKLYFSSDMLGGKGGSDIYYCLKQSNGEWSSPINLKEINTVGDELFPFISNDDVVYFSSNGHVGLGGLDVFKFDGGIENVGVPINSNQDDFSYMFLDEKKGYFSSDRKDNIDRIYSFDLLIFNGILELTAVDFKTKKGISDLEVLIFDRDKKDTLSFKTNDEGVVFIPIVSNKDYVVLGQKKDYELKAPLYLNTDALSSNETIQKDLFFDHKRYDIIVKTVDKSTGDLIGNVDGEFVDPNTGEIIKYKTNEQGMASVNLDNYHPYIATAHKRGYLDLQEDVYTSSELLIELDLKLEEIKKNMTFKIENIFYDLDKSNLRDTSKIELDKLVEFLHVNSNIKVELSSHTDSRGSDSYNKSLSQRRAQSCVDYLIQKGVPESQIIAKGYGETKLVNECSNGINCSEEEHQENRRTEIRILEVKELIND